MKHLSAILGAVALTALVACGGESDAGMGEMDDEMAPSGEMMTDTMTTDSMAVDSMEQGMPEEMMDEGTGDEGEMGGGV